jgi:hypothetical protein
VPTPFLYRRAEKTSGADADFAGTQVAPGSALLLSAVGLTTIAVSFVPYTALDAVSTGTLDIQCILVNTPAPWLGAVQPALVNGSAVSTSLALGAEAQFTVTGSAQFAIRVASVAGLAVAADYYKIFIRPIG